MSLGGGFRLLYDRLHHKGSGGCHEEPIRNTERERETSSRINRSVYQVMLISESGLAVAPNELTISLNAEWGQARKQIDLFIRQYRHQKADWLLLRKGHPQR